MFAKKKDHSEKNIIKEQLGKIKERLTTNLSEITLSCQQAESNLSQIQENVENTVSYAATNVETQTALLQSLEAFESELKESFEWKETVLSNVEKVRTESERLVEENKHFTTPSKYLSDAPANMRGISEESKESLNRMKDLGKQMGVLALNAAIEAGRMGEVGSNFVKAAEEVRVQAKAYDDELAVLKESQNKQDEVIAKLEEQIHYLVGLLTENNLSTSKLMKQCKDTCDELAKSSARDYSNDIALVKESILTVRSAEEEMLKAQERNKIQIEDIRGEFQLQQEQAKDVLAIVEEEVGEA